jgi:glucose-6-phosphate isomerase
MPYSVSLSKEIMSSPVWNQLLKNKQELQNVTISDLFENDQDRMSRCVEQYDGLSWDFSKHRANDHTFSLLCDLAVERGVPAGVEAMFRGDRINQTENRSVLHTALRLPRTASLVVEGTNIVPLVHETLDRMYAFAEGIRNRSTLGSTGKPITNIINIGIGGSDLGPVMAYEALKAYTDRELSFHFVSNVDSSDIHEALLASDPETTLCIIASKTFTTAETMTNAQTARAWFETRLGVSFDVSKHFVALSTNQKLVSEFGITQANTFGFWEWVGGRFSMESAIGLSTVIAVGRSRYEELLAGFRSIDTYVKDADVRTNAVYRMALLGVWYRNFWNMQTYAILPYENYLKRFPAYLQQLLMESNGKSVTLQGEDVEHDTSPVYWGEPGTNGQHSFHQMLHQGTSPMPVDFLLGRRPVHELGSHHTLLQAHCLAQASVLAFGKSAEVLRAEGVSENLIPHKVMPGNRPSTLILFDSMSPYVLGQLVSMYEHVTLIQGLIWGVGSFDQWGVELGKVVAGSIVQALAGEEVELDSSTAWAVAHLKNDD